MYTLSNIYPCQFFIHFVGQVTCNLILFHIGLIVCLFFTVSVTVIYFPSFSCQDPFLIKPSYSELLTLATFTNSLSYTYNQCVFRNKFILLPHAYMNILKPLTENRLSKHINQLQMAQSFFRTPSSCFHPSIQDTSSQDLPFSTLLASCHELQGMGNWHVVDRDGQRGQWQAWWKPACISLQGHRAWERKTNCSKQQSFPKHLFQSSLDKDGLVKGGGGPGSRGKFVTIHAGKFNSGLALFATTNL